MTRDEYNAVVLRDHATGLWRWTVRRGDIVVATGTRETRLLACLEGSLVYERRRRGLIDEECTGR